MWQSIGLEINKGMYCNYRKAELNEILQHWVIYQYDLILFIPVLHNLYSRISVSPSILTIKLNQVKLIIRVQINTVCLIHSPEYNSKNAD